MITLFLVGILEMIIITVWTKVVTDTKVLASGIVTMINIFIWYYALQQIIEDISNWQLVAWYALGCSIGTAASTYYFQWKEQREAAAEKAVAADAAMVVNS